MVQNPEVQKRAQQELDTVIGHGRLPTMDDRSRLPYMEALLLEVLRYHPIGPMGMLNLFFCYGTHSVRWARSLSINDPRYPTLRIRRRLL